MQILRRRLSASRGRTILAGVVAAGVLVLCALVVPSQLSDNAPTHTLGASATTGSAPRSSDEGGMTMSDMAMDCGSLCPTGTTPACLALLALATMTLFGWILLKRPGGGLRGVLRRRLIELHLPVGAAPAPATPSLWALCVMRV